MADDIPQYEFSAAEERLHTGHLARWAAAQTTWPLRGAVLAMTR